MTHESRLPQCEQFQCEVKKDVARVESKIDKHEGESVPVRSNVDKHNEQILTLNKAHEATMADIRDIKNDIASVKQSVSDIGVQVSKDVLGVRIWVLCGVLASAAMFAIPMFNIASTIGRSQERVEINTKRLDQIEAVLRPVQTQHVVTER